MDAAALDLRLLERRTARGARRSHCSCRGHRRMSRFLQLHILTFFPPANLNRDDTGRPKTAVVGGATRLRLSSQALKRAWRTSDIFAAALKGHMGQRTQRLGEVVLAHLLDRGMPEAAALELARDIGGVFGKVKDAKDPNPARIE